MAYIVIRKTPFYRWRQETIKAKEGVLLPDFKLDGSPSGDYLIVNDTLPGGNSPPYAVTLVDLQVEGTEPPPTGDTITVNVGDGQWTIKNTNSELDGTYENIDAFRVRKTVG